MAPQQASDMQTVSNFSYSLRLERSCLEAKQLTNSREDHMAGFLRHLF
jgi:hypothetical protein